MKKKIYIFLVFLSTFLFIQSINARTCKYVEDKAYLKERNARSYNVENGRNSSGYFELNDSNDGNFQFNFICNMSTGKSNDASIDIDNWSGTDEMSKELGIDASSTHFAHELSPNGVCPESVFIRTGEVCWGGADWDAYILNNSSEAERVLNWGVSKNKWWKKSLLFILKLKNSSENKKTSTKTKSSTTSYRSCDSFTSSGKTKCENNPYFSCLWVSKKIGDTKTVEYCNFDKLTYVRCGDSWDIPDKLPSITSFIVNFIKIVTPIILIFVSILSLLKATASSKEDEIKKAQSILVRRIIAAVIVFFIIQITQFVIFKVADDKDVDNMSTCLSCMLNNSCSKNKYYKTSEGDDFYCTFLNDKNHYYNCETGELLGAKSSITYDASDNDNDNSHSSYSGGGTKLPSAEGSYSGGTSKIPSAEGSYSGGGREF